MKYKKNENNRLCKDLYTFFFLGTGHDWCARHAMGTGTWQQQPSANGCQVPVPMADFFA